MAKDGSISFVGQQWLNHNVQVTSAGQTQLLRLFVCLAIAKELWCSLCELTVLQFFEQIVLDATTGE